MKDAGVGVETAAFGLGIVSVEDAVPAGPRSGVDKMREGCRCRNRSV